jgi:hypothetical protein
MGTASNFISKNPIQIQVAQGTAPLSVVSTTLVSNLNVDMIDGVHLAGLVQTSTLGANSGVATLDSTGKLTSAQIPDVLVGAVVYKGVWNASTNTPSLTSSTGTKGNYYKVSVAGTTTIDTINSWAVGDTIIFEVISVAGRIGAVTLTSADLTDATTIGKNLVTLTNPSVITFPRFNADNTVSALDAATFRTAIGAGTSSNAGTVTSVTAGNGLTQSGTASINPTIDVVSATGTAGSVGTLTVTSDAVGVTLGTTSTSACAGNDTRLSDARTPTAHTHGNITNTGYLGVAANIPLITGTAGIIQAGSFGTTAATFAEGNHTHSGYQPLDTDLTNIAALTGTSGFLKTNGAGTWSVDTATYGSVASVGLSLPSMFTVANSPVTTTGTLTATLASQTANTVLAAPNGAAGAPTFRTLVSADIPTLNQNTTGSAATLVTTHSSVVSGSLTTSAVTPGQVMASFAAGTYRSLEVHVQVTQGANLMTNKLLVIHDGTNAYITEYGAITIGTSQATFDANIVGGNVQIQVTPTTTSSTVFKYQATLINI